MSSVCIGRIPLVLLDEVTRYLASADLAILSQVSKLSSSLVTGVLYNEIRLHDPTRILQCCRTLAAKSSAADCVTKLTLKNDFPSDSFLSIFHFLAPLAFRRLTHVIELHISIFTPKDGFCDFICDSTFPTLFKLHCPTPLNNDKLARFLNRHPSIESLSLGPVGGGFQSEIFQSVCLPNLVRYHGFHELASAVIPGSVIETITVYCDYDTTRADFASLMDALNRSRSPSISVKFFFVDWSLGGALAKAIELRPPRLHSLVIEVNAEPDPEQIERFLDAIHYAAPHLNKLEILDINIVPAEDELSYHDSAELGGKFEAEWADMAELGTLCPSLQRCKLPSGVTWFKVASLWLPDATYHPVRLWLDKTMKRKARYGPFCRWLLQAGESDDFLGALMQTWPSAEEITVLQNFAWVTKTVKNRRLKIQPCKWTRERHWSAARISGPLECCTVGLLVHVVKTRETSVI